MKRFIHIPKNAGTSVRPWVYPMSYKDTKQGLPEFIKKIGLDKHLPHSKLKPDSMFDDQFAIVRNPWARVVSLYHEMARLRDIPDFENTEYYTWEMSFLTFISKIKDFNYEDHWWCNPPHKCFANQVDWLVLHRKTEPLVQALPFDNLQTNLKSILGHQVFLQWLNRSKFAGNYKDYYNDYSKRIVAEHFGRDIEYYGFKFETEATKNVYRA